MDVCSRCIIVNEFSVSESFGVAHAITKKARDLPGKPQKNLDANRLLDISGKHLIIFLIHV